MANYTRTLSLIGVTGDGSDETSKFVGQSGFFDGEGVTVRVSAIPTNVQVGNVFWSVPTVEGAGVLASYPSEPDMIPVTRSLLSPALAYGAWSEDTGHKIGGDLFGVVHSHYGGHGDEEQGSVTLVRLNVSSGAVTHEHLWRPDAASPLGYIAAAAGAIDHTQFVLVSKRTGDRDWKLMRRSLPHWKEYTNVLSTVSGSNVMRISKSAMPWGAFTGMTFQFNTPPGAPIAGISIDDETIYRVSLVTTAEVRFTPLTGAFPNATATVNNTGGRIALKVFGTDWAEVLFAGGVSWGAQALTFPGVAPGQPGYVLGNAFSQRLNNTGVGCFAAGKYIFPMTGLLNGVAPNFASITQAYEANLPNNNLGGPSIAYYDSGSGAETLVGVFRARDLANAAPQLWYTRDNFATFKFVPLPAGVAINCNIPCVVTQNYGKGARLQLVAPSRRDPGGEFKRLEVYLWDVGIEALLAAPPATAGNLFERYCIGHVDYYDHNATPTGGDGPAVNGVGTLVELPDGGGLWAPMGYQPPIPVYRSNNLAGHIAFKIDTRRFTGCPDAPSLSVDHRLFPESVIARYEGVLAAATNANIRFARSNYDLTLGNYDPAIGVYEAREQCRIRFNFALPAATNNTDFYVKVWDVGANAEYAEPFGDGACPYTAYGKQNGGTLIVRGSVSVQLDVGQQVALRPGSGSVVASGSTPPLSRLAWLEIERLA